MNQIHSLLSLCFVLLIVSAASINKDGDAQIISNWYTFDKNGNYDFSFETSNGITRRESGTIVNKDQPNQSFIVNGQYTYLNTEGEKVIVNYIADENGYRLVNIEEMVLAGVPANVLASLIGK